MFEFEPHVYKFSYLTYARMTIRKRADFFGPKTSACFETHPQGIRILVAIFASGLIGSDSTSLLLPSDGSPQGLTYSPIDSVSILDVEP